MTTPTLIITPRRTALLAGHDNELDVLVRVQEPDLPSDRPTRSPLHLALVIDRSGSMAGQPLAEAKRCAEFVLDGLLPTDRLSVVAYDDHVQTLVPAAPLDDKESVRHAIRAIFEGGSTALHAGWLQSAGTLAPLTRDDVTSRVILLSDGCANHGLTDPAQIHAQCAELARAGVTTSTYGLGNHFNEELMIGMARHGRGSAYYGRTVDDLMDPFREEFELLNATCARRLRLEVGPAAGVGVTMLNDYVTAEDGGWWLPDLAYSGEAWAVVRLKVRAPAASALSSGAAASNGATEAPIALASFALRYATPDGEPRAIQPSFLALPTLAAAAFHAIAEDELVARRAGELEAARLQSRARQAAARGDWHGVAAALKRAESVAVENAWVRASLAELRSLAEERNVESFAKESAFAAQKLSTRLAACNESSGAYDAPAKAAYLRRKASQGKGEPKQRGS